MKKKQFITALILAASLLAACQPKAKDDADFQADHKRQEAAQAIQTEALNSQVVDGQGSQENANHTTKNESQTTESPAPLAGQNQSGGNTTTAGTNTSSRTPWSANKSQQLANYMVEWGAMMGQSYNEYWPGNSVDFYGLAVPDRVMTLADNMPARYPEEFLDPIWSKDGDAQGHRTAIVACYSDADTQDYLEKHLYFFAFVDGQPKVLCTMQNQGGQQPAGLYFFESENVDLTNFFYRLARE